MSASDKKKLRKEQAAAFMSERQRQEQAEAKKLKIYTITFITVIALIACTAIGILGFRAYEQSGIVQKSTIAAVVGDRELNSVVMNYYFTDTVQDYYNDWYNEYSTYTDTYLQMVGLDTSKPLNEQKYATDEFETWADFFMDSAVQQAKKDYALYDKAVSENFELPEEGQESIDALASNLEYYATTYGYSNVDKYLSAIYGFGSTVDSYVEYAERTALASAFYDAHKDSLVYDDAALREYEKDKYNDFSSYDYSSSYLTYTEFLQGGTEDAETGETVYSDEEKAAARDAMETAAKEAATATSYDELKEKIEAIEVNKESQTALNSANRVLHTDINETLSAWLADEEREEGDIAALPVITTTKNEETGEEISELNAYYVVYFTKKYENLEPMGNVRHLLVEFEGGTEDETTGETVYSDEEKAAAKEAADGYLNTWLEGEATEESFIELVKEHSDDSSADEGGLFEDIHPKSEYVANFRNWATDPDRQTGDTEVIETEYGYHVMYYVGDDELTYRDYMIENTLRDTDQETWYKAIIDPVTFEAKNTSKINLGLTLASN